MTQDNSTDLWMVLAVIQEFKLDAVTLALEQLPGFGGMTVSACRGFGQEKLRDIGSNDSNSTGPRAVGIVDFTSKIKLEIAVAGQKHADDVVETIARAAHTGRRGDGKILVWPVSRAVRIRTMETNGEAIETSARSPARQNE